MTIYDIDDAILALVDKETGELLDYDAFAELQMQRDAKIEAMISWHKSLNAEAEAIKAEIKSLTERAAARIRKADRLKAYIGYVTDGKPYKCAKGETTWRKSTAVEVAEGAELPDEYMRVKTTREPDKVALKDALKAGTVIQGATLVEQMNMTII